MNNLCVIWVVISVSFSSYFIISMVYKKLSISNLKNGLLLSNGLILLNLKHLLGIVFFGILPYIIIPELRYLINTLEVLKLQVLIAFLGILFLSVFVSYLSVKKYSNNEKTDLNHYNISYAWPYFFIRFLFLLCYEFFFRGILFFLFLEYLNVTLSILCSVALYLLIHMFDSLKEILGAIPFGMILCLLTYFTNSIWYAFIIHLALSSVYEISIFYYLTHKNKITL